MQQQAAVFWKQMETFSARVHKALDLAVVGSPHGGPAWEAIKPAGARAPTGAIIHWTAADTLSGTVRWFADPKSQVSAHMVVADRRLWWAEDLHADLPLVAALPATAVQCRGIEQTAWHARDLNGTYYGIENQNVGMLQGRANALCYSQNGKLVSYRSDKAAVRCYGAFYEPYTAEQVQTNLAVLRYVQAYFGGTIRAPRVLGHSNVQGPQTFGSNENKLDPGPAFPLRWLRDNLCIGLQPDEETPVLDGDKVLRAGWARAAIYAYRVKEGRYNKAALGDILTMSDDTAWSAFLGFAARPSLLEDFPPLARAAVQALGFDLAASLTAHELLESIQLVQRLLGLKTDGIVGPKTSQALAARFRQIFVPGQSFNQALLS